jgi:hypothetical protein
MLRIARNSFCQRMMNDTDFALSVIDEMATRFYESCWFGYRFAMWIDSLQKKAV